MDNRDFFYLSIQSPFIFACSSQLAVAAFMSFVAYFLNGVK